MQLISHYIHLFLQKYLHIYYLDLVAFIIIQTDLFSH